MRYELTIPPNTPQGKPLSQVFFYTASPNGRIQQWTVRVPLGHCYLAGLQVRTGRAGRVIPGLSSGTSWLIGNGDVVSGVQNIQLDPPQYAIEMRGYNEDDTYPHTFYLDLE